MQTDKTLVLNNTQIEQKINRIAYQIYENNYEEKEIIIAGIAPNGYLLAQRICKILKKLSPLKVILLKIEVNKANPMESNIQLGLAEKEIKDKVVVIVDDVLNSGKTLIYGAKPFLSTKVKRITTVVLVDRNHNRYPIKADFVGISLATTLKEHISVELDEVGKEAVYLH